MGDNRFDEAANRWDKPERVSLATSIHNAIREKISLTGEEKLIDFGCGTGLLSLPFAPNVQHITGIDTSTGMLDEMLRKAEGSGFSNVSAHECDLVDGECDIEPAHLLISSMSFHHVKNLEALCARIYNLLLPGGRVAVADLFPEDGLFHKPGADFMHRGIDPDYLARILTENGFIIESIDTVTVLKREREGREREYPVFLLVARR